MRCFAYLSRGVRSGPTITLMAPVPGHHVRRKARAESSRAGAGPKRGIEGVQLTGRVDARLRFPNRYGDRAAHTHLLEKTHRCRPWTNRNQRTWLSRLLTASSTARRVPACIAASDKCAAKGPIPCIIQ